MKTRQGFVSNSSSSSFMLIGADVSYMDFETILRKIIPGDELDKEIETLTKYYPNYETSLKERKDMLREAMYELIYNADYMLLEGSENGVPKGSIVIGKALADEGSMGVEEFTDNAKKIQKELDFKDEDIKIYWGTRMC
jgi:hypothetical protein